jgi:hypothetical protein
MWAYNKASGATDYMDLANPVYYPNAYEQYQKNCVDIQKSALQPGDLLFTHTDPSKPNPNHVAMYVGDFYYPGGTIDGTDYNPGIYNYVSASWTNTISAVVPRHWQHPENWNNTNASNYNVFKAFARISAAVPPGVTIVARCPVDLVVTDPDGNTLTKAIWQIEGVMYYRIYDTDGDGSLDDVVTIPERKTGDYLITVVPEAGALPTDTYTLDFTADNTTITLANDVPVAAIPAGSYAVNVSPGGVPVDVTGGGTNMPPSADAGPDQTVEGTSPAGAPVTLDGSGSSDDAQPQPLTYSWTWAGGSATGVNPTVTIRY